MMKRIFVCSEFGGLEVNAGAAAQCCRYVVLQGHNPFAPHVFYPFFLNEGVPQEREIGIDCGLDWMSCCDEVWVFARHGRISRGMRQEITAAIENKMEVKYYDASLLTFSIEPKTPDVSVILPLPHIPCNQLPTEAELLSAKDFATKASKGLANVAKALKKGVRYEDLQEEVDRLLGDSEQVRDEALEERWEEDYRANR